METVRYIFDLAMQGFWHFLGCVIILGIFARVATVAIIAIFNHLNIIARGWPQGTSAEKKDEKN